MTKANEALNKMAENARELGLDYESDGMHHNKPAQQEPVGCEGAIVNGRVYADRLEHDYKFECEAGSLHLCTDWVEFRRCFEWLAQHTSLPAQQPAQQEPVAYIHRQGNHYEVSERFLSDDEKSRGWTEEPLYTAPPAQRTWAGLTDEDINDLVKEFDGLPITLSYAIEAKLKEKNA